MEPSIRRLTHDDIPQAMRLKDAAGWNQTAADWQIFISSNSAGCFAAEHDGRLIGTVTTIVYEERFAWIGMLLVDLQFRGRGIGRALLEHAIRHLDKRGIACAKLDATPQGKPLYQKLGFVAEYEIERWALPRPPGQENAAALAPAEGDLAAALKLDREIFGADRGSVLRRVARSAPEFVQIARGGNEIAGYTFGRHGSLADHLGPWVAREKATASMQLDQFLRHSTRELLFVDCVLENSWAAPLARARGFELSRPLTRMFRGENRYPGKPGYTCAGLGPEFG